MSKVQHLQLLQHHLQKVSTQKQELEAEISEVSHAAEEVHKASTTYRLLGPVLLAAEPQSLARELLEKKGRLELRLKTLFKQEERLQKNIGLAQTEALAELKRSSLKKSS